MNSRAHPKYKARYRVRVGQKWIWPWAAENAFVRCKTMLGYGHWARSLSAQETEIAFGRKTLSRLLSLGWPGSVAIASPGSSMEGDEMVQSDSCTNVA